MTNKREVHVDNGTGEERSPRGKEPFMIVERKGDYEFVEMANVVNRGRHRQHGCRRRTAKVGVARFIF